MSARITQQKIENRLWDAADELRVAMPEAQYSAIFPLMFWKYVEAHYLVDWTESCDVGWPSRAPSQGSGTLETRRALQ